MLIGFWNFSQVSTVYVLFLYSYKLIFHISGEIQEKGMLLPLSPDIYRTMLSRLREAGLNSIEKTYSI